VLADHFHRDHLLALLLKYSAEQLNTLVNFESALLRLNGQFSVGVNTGTPEMKKPAEVLSRGGFDCS
jgi:hypothetical protein